jgi:hypothetical protein
MAAESLLVVRSHVVTPAVTAMAEELGAATGMDVVLALDEMDGPLDSGHLPKVGIDRSVLDSLGLFHGTARPLWRCGDYALCAVRARHPGYRTYWMVEPDVRLNVAGKGTLFRRFEGEEADFLAGYVGEAPAQWDWRPCMEPFHAGIHRSFFALVRLSGRALDLVVEARRRHLQRLAEATRSGRVSGSIRWPNDEVFVATVLAEAGLTSRDLNAVAGPLYTPETFGPFRPWLRHDFDRMGIDGRLYHPVLEWPGFVAKILKHAGTRATLERVQARLAHGAGREIDDAGAASLRAAIDTALARLP